MNNDRFRFRVYDCVLGKYIYENDAPLPLRFYKNGIGFGICPTLDVYKREAEEMIIEQCTGLNDKNGILGYHHDYFINEFGVKCMIEWDKDKWIGFNENGVIFNIGQWFHKCEIIGNVHEQGE